MSLLRLYCIHQLANARLLIGHGLHRLRERLRRCVESLLFGGQVVRGLAQRLEPLYLVAGSCLLCSDINNMLIRDSFSSYGSSVVGVQGLPVSAARGGGSCGLLQLLLELGKPLLSFLPECIFTLVTWDWVDAIHPASLEVLHPESICYFFSWFFFSGWLLLAGWLLLDDFLIDGLFDDFLIDDFLIDDFFVLGPCDCSS